MNIADFPDVAFAAYLAGFLDGEGSIEIHPQECGTRIRIANTFKPVLDGFHARLGIGRVEKYHRPAGKNFQPLFAFSVSNAHDCRTVLTLTRPFLHVKAERADYALAVIERMQQRMNDLDARNREILAAINAGEMQKDIGRRFGISPSLVSRIKLGHTWPCEIARLNGRKGLKKGCRPKDMIFRLHGDPLSSPCR